MQKKKSVPSSETTIKQVESSLSKEDKLLLKKIKTAQRNLDDSIVAYYQTIGLSVIHTKDLEVLATDLKNLQVTNDILTGTIINIARNNNDHSKYIIEARNASYEIFVNNDDKLSISIHNK